MALKRILAAATFRTPCVHPEVEASCYRSRETRDRAVSNELLPTSPKGTLTLGPTGLRVNVSPQARVAAAAGATGTHHPSLRHFTHHNDSRLRSAPAGSVRPGLRNILPG
jgi:hypothetical protein